MITFNRVVFGLLLLMLLDSYRVFKLSDARVVKSSSGDRAYFSLTRFEIAWALLSTAALASALAQSNNVAYATRIAVDTFWLPLFAFHFARKGFNLRAGGRILLLGCMALALFLFSTGAIELVTGMDLFRYKGAELVREGERRVNGPFAADSSFAIICLILFIFLLAAPKLIRARFDRSGKLIYVCATAAAALGALLSLFRIVAFALVVCWVAQWSLTRHDPRLRMKGADIRRLAPVGAVIAVFLVLAGGWIMTTLPERSRGRLINTRSVFGRLATWQGAVEIALDNPVFGVGLANYAEYYDATHYYSDVEREEIRDTKAADSPHSNLLWIVSELGLPAAAAYILANLYLFLMGWRALNRAEGQRQLMAAACFLSLVVAYWIPGLTLTSGYYSDLNLYFSFLLGALTTEFSGA
jgi:O-antigen ligase